MPYPHNSRFAGTRPRRSAPAGPAFPVRREVPAGVISSPPTTQGLLEQSAFLLAEADPIAAVRTVALALKRQSPGAKLIAARALIATLAEREPPAFLDAIAAEIARLAAPILKSA